MAAPSDFAVPGQGLNEVPEPVRQKLERFCDQLQRALGEKLVSVILYGGLAKGEYFAVGSDVNVMVVLTRVTVEELDQAAPAIWQGMRDFNLAVMTLSERDLQRSAAVFPVKFLDIQEHHQVLLGRDVLSALAVSRDHLRLRGEQQIKNLLLRLRQLYLRRARRPELVENTLATAISSLISSLSVLLILKTGESPVGKPAIVEEACHQFGMDEAVLRDVLALKAGKYDPDPSQLRKLYDDFMACVERAADVIESL